jgi:hypothetical protein
MSTQDVAGETRGAVRSLPLLGIVTQSGSAYRAANQYGGPMRYVLSAIIMVLTCLTLSTAQAAGSDERESLVGLPGVLVVIEEINPEAQTDGLSVEAIQTAVELIFRSSGIPVLTPSEREMTPSRPCLYVQVNALNRGPTYAVSLEVRLTQQVSLVHRPGWKMIAATWNGDSVIIVGKAQLRMIISENIGPLVKAFANDFLAVNPR